MPAVKVNNISLYYKIRGRGQPLLLISGLNADHASWDSVRGNLARDFRVVAFDNRSSGRSSAPKRKYSIRDMADDAAGLLEHLEIKKCHVIGHSMGGYIAQEFAIHYPERVGKLILAASAPVSSARNNMLFYDFLRRFEKSRDNEALMRSWAYWSFSPKTFERKNYIATFIKKSSAYPYLQSAFGFRSQIDAIAGFDARAGMRDIRAKTLVIIGSDDILIYPAESRRLAEGIKGSIFKEIKDAGHCLHVEKPAEFTAKVARFLKG